MKNTLVIINGVTGAIGTALLAEFSREENVTIYGLSRKALNFKSYLDNGLLPQSSLICSIGADVSNRKSCEDFVGRIDKKKFSKIIYIHAIGEFPFEINKLGKFEVKNDEDGDGINDQVVKLSHDAFFSMVDSLDGLGIQTEALIIGAIADRYKPEVHQSWWRVMTWIKNEMQTSVLKNVSFKVLNISSVICPHEMLTRPFVFQSTNADPKFWLKPNEVAEKIRQMTTSKKVVSYVEEDLFHRATYHNDNYFNQIDFTERKKGELGVIS